MIGDLPALWMGAIPSSERAAGRGSVQTLRLFVCFASWDCLTADRSSFLVWFVHLFNLNYVKHH